MMQEGFDVDLPEVEAGAISAADEPLVITIDSKKRVYIGKRAFKVGELEEKLRAIGKTKKHDMVLIRADESVPYGIVISAMAEVRKAGITKVGMITEPLEGR
jgi:biopolymer transport protein TolR